MFYADDYLQEIFFDLYVGGFVPARIQAIEIHIFFAGVQAIEIHIFSIILDELPKREYATVVELMIQTIEI